LITRITTHIVKREIDYAGYSALSRRHKPQDDYLLCSRLKRLKLITCFYNNRQKLIREKSWN